MTIMLYYGFILLLNSSRYPSTIINVSEYILGLAIVPLLQQRVLSDAVHTRNSALSPKGGAPEKPQSIIVYAHIKLKVNFEFILSIYFLESYCMLGDVFCCAMPHTVYGIFLRHVTCSVRHSHVSCCM